MGTTLRDTIYLITPKLALGGYRRDTIGTTYCPAMPELALGNYHRDYLLSRRA